jgi:hypothetical protein
MKIYKFIFVSIIQSILFFQTSRVHCQEKLLLDGIDVSAIASIHYFSSGLYGSPDPSWKDRIDTEIIALGWSDYPGSSYNANGDTISMFYKYYSRTYTISFILDTIGKRLLNFLFAFTEDPFGGSAYGTHRRYSFSLTTINFQRKGDTSIFVDESGKKCKDDLTDATWTYDNFFETDHRSYIDDKSELDSLINDTSKYSFSLALVSQKPINSVSFSKSINDCLTIFNSLPNHSVHFSFPAFVHTQPLFIYDIIGREVKRIEISSGVSEYSLSQGQLASGYYFARLGNLGAKFMVW